MTQKDNNPRSAKSHLRFAIFAFIMPGALFTFSLLMLVVVNLIFNPTFWMTGDTEPANPTPFAITVLNMLFLTTGSVGLISLLPGVVAGILLLTRSKYQKTK